MLRQDPDVVVIGEMRDLETVTTAMTAAETGHLVLATLHTPDAVQTIQRIFSVFPPEQQNNIMYQLANTLQAILAQRLLPRADGKGQILACEVCIATPAVRKRIREGEPHLLFSEMQMGRKHQMQTIDGVLLDYYQRGEITYDVAMSNAREPETIRQANDGRVAVRSRRARALCRIAQEPRSRRPRTADAFPCGRAESARMPRGPNDRSRARPLRGTSVSSLIANRPRAHQ